MDIDQLGETIKGHYGQGYDGQRYLKKFFHLQLKLPEPDLRAFCLNAIKRLSMDSIFEGRDLSNSESNAFSADFITRLAKSYNLSLREVERLLLEAGAIYSSNSKLNPELSQPILWLLAQKQRDTSLFESLLNQQISAAEAWEHIRPHTQLLFGGFLNKESYFRTVLTLLLEGQTGVSTLSQDAENRVAQDSTSQDEKEYWTCIHWTASQIDTSQSHTNYMNIVGDTINLLGYRPARDDTLYDH